MGTAAGMARILHGGGGFMTGGGAFTDGSLQKPLLSVIPAKAGIYSSAQLLAIRCLKSGIEEWVPAFAGTTIRTEVSSRSPEIAPTES